MNIGNSPRHTRRGFLGGNNAPKVAAPASDFGLPPVDCDGSFRQSDLAHFPAPPADVIDSDPGESFESPDKAPVRLQNAFAAVIEAASANSSGNAFLSWLAEQLSDQASRTRLLDDEVVEYENASEILEENFLCPSPCESESLLVAVGAVASAPVAQNPFERGRINPSIEMTADGGRCETFAAGSKIIKDGIGRVVEVRSQFGDCLYFQYGLLGQLEHFERTDSCGRVHSWGQKDRHGVVVRDYQGRVRAAGETMAVDPRGCFYLHTFDGQYSSLDLVTGVHVERRRVVDDAAETDSVVTSLFTHDGFRMATVFSGTTACRYVVKNPQNLANQASGQDLRFRFYGRDGTLIEFASEDELRRLQPSKVSPPASRKVARSWQKKRQAGTAWDSVREYLMRVS